MPGEVLGGQAVLRELTSDLWLLHPQTNLPSSSLSAASPQLALPNPLSPS